MHFSNSGGLPPELPSWGIRQGCNYFVLNPRQMSGFTHSIDYCNLARRKLAYYICGSQQGNNIGGQPASGGVILKSLYAALSFSLMVLQIVALFCAFTQPAYAYADPGSGLLAIQIFSSFFAGMIFLIRGRIRRLFGTRHSSPKSEDVVQK
jgi:hypothetical protein